MKKTILALSAFLILGGSLSGQISVDENENEKVTGIKVEGPAESGDIKRAKDDSLKFISGDLFNGVLSKVDDKGLVWQHPDATADITFKKDNLDVVNLGHVPVTLRRDGVANITLTNGDRLFGIIDEMNAEYLIIDTWYAGKIKLERPMVQSISSGGKVSKAIYEGPNNLEEWTVANRGSWDFKNDYLYNTRQYGGVGKDVKLPDRSNIEFTVQYKERINLQIHFYTDRVHSTGGNAYQLVFNSRYCFVQRYSNHRGSDQLGSFNLKSLKSKFKVSIRTDKEKKNIIILIDGKIVKRISDSNEFAGKGTGLLFYSHQGDIKISDIKVSEWSGAVGSTDAGAKVKDKDSIVFINKDTVTGELQTIKDNKVIFKTPFAPLTIPIDRIASITMGEEGYEKPRRNAGDVEMYFPEGAGRITLNLKDILDSRVNGSSENFGESSFDIRAFDKVIFNIYTEKKKEEEDDW